MNSSSTAFHTIDDDDDGFDWEAAVQEIDLACSNLPPTATVENPTSNSSKLDCNVGVASNPSTSVHKKGNLNAGFASFPSNTKQSTLDRFIGNSRSKPQEEVGVYSNINYSDGNGNGNVNDGVIECEGVEAPNEFVKIDPEAAKTWIYPVNIPRREYQFSITKTALFSNTLVVLPTGLGKTLIAAVVMYNYFRWFPEGKIVFAAPSRPLVMQQIEACHNIVGIPQEWTIDLTGQTNPARRAGLWKEKRVFFVTPQVLEKDIHSGSCLVKYLVCLVIDEAHRAMGNYAYCVAVRELLDAPVQLRILALTATPGSKQQTIQQVINNLQISTLEHRSESDHDVLPYVHARKLELIEVAMGNEAVKINNLLLEVIRPLVSRLSAFGVLPRRDVQTLSPCDFLSSRDKFRQEPPRGLPEAKKAEIESHFTVLITLYHVKKLLSSHGIRPALEMLEEKLTQGYFARLVSRNEVLLKAKLIMQQTVSHGAPSPKLAKLLEVLTNHFKVKDPQNSRVIIFSNFRGSVRDIMDVLTNLGGFVKATEFIGQSSGKTLKGQSQKVQQAVLQKFRTGGYNVIVATSIGEEGLDIMEVDLVICFDANVSPLRMIQRMGRTGRKHEGRVVLACEGSELKGYLRKKANSNAIKKHMHNGGMNSFNFHSSPRMIPHIYKPQVQLLELSIKEFVPRGKNHNDDNTITVPAFKTKLTEVEKDLLANYFASSAETSWKPSLIVFPHFQAYPSPVNKVAHSSRTGMLIDTMQYLQGLTFSNDHRTPLTKDEDMLDPYLRSDALESCNKAVKDSDKLEYAGEEKLQTVEESDTEYGGFAGTEDVHIEDLQEKPHVHTFLFDTEFVSVDDLGNVLVLSLSQLHLESHSKFFNGNNFTSHLMGNSSAHDKRVHAKVCVASQSGSPEGGNVPESILRNPDAIKGSVLPTPEKILQTPFSNGNDILVQDHHVERVTAVMQMECEPTDELGDPELSPRLSGFVKSGVVPESPIHNSGTWSVRGNPLEPSIVSSLHMQTEFSKNSWQHEGEKIQDGSLSKLDVAPLGDEDAQAPEPCLVESAKKECTPPVSVTKETQTPLAKLSNTSNSDDWLLEPGVDVVAVTQPCKFKRLRKHGSMNREVPPGSDELTDRNRNLRIRRAVNNDSDKKFVKGRKRRAKDAAVYIDEEAEISSDGMASADEDEPASSSYEDSFIDDGANPTYYNTPAGASRPDMMAVYRRSLLSQSPFPRLPNISTDFSPGSVVQSSKLDASGGSSGTKDVQTPEIGLESIARNLQPASNKIPSEPVEDENKLDSRKRKLSCYQEKSVPMVDLSKEFSLLSEAVPKDTSMQMQAEKMEQDAFLDDDDLFYQGIDLDAIEEEATRQLRLISECSTQKAATAQPSVLPNLDFLGSPSFDLGF